jgi:TetR/AcrR family transcriptional repressor of nem operon
VRYPESHKAETHAKIVAAAARSFREHGAEAEGIGAVMAGLGLTKGGFYRHFGSKDDLVAEAVAVAFEEISERLVRIAEAAPQGRALQAIVEHYLSREHLEAPGSGCVLAALAAEIARLPVPVRRRIGLSIRAYRDVMAAYMPGDSLDERRERFGVLFPAMAGVLAAARVLEDDSARERMLAAARSFFVDSFAAATLG